MMKTKIKSFIGIVSFSAILVGMAQNFVSSKEKNRIVISGQILRIGEPPTNKDGWHFRLIEYRVRDVCEGNYNKEKIIVSHIPEPELDELKIGTNVCVVVGKSEGPTIKDDFTIDLKGKDTHYINDGLFLKNCECHR